MVQENGLDTAVAPVSSYLCAFTALLTSSSSRVQRDEPLPAYPRPVRSAAGGACVPGARSRVSQHSVGQPAWVLWVKNVEGGEGMGMGGWWGLAFGEGRVRAGIRPVRAESGPATSPPPPRPPHPPGRLSARAAAPLPVVEFLRSQGTADRGASRLQTGRGQRSERLRSIKNKHKIKALS